MMCMSARVEANQGYSYIEPLNTVGLFRKKTPKASDKFCAARLDNPVPSSSSVNTSDFQCPSMLFNVNGNFNVNGK